jgi:hypothetical protein
MKNLDGLLIPKWIKGIAKSKLDDYFSDPNNDIDLELKFQDLIKDLKEVIYP